jgi:DNA-binding CsgD family transcriptional regulator
MLDPAARQALDRIAADPFAPLLLGISGPGRFGKSTVLARLHRLYDKESVPVATLDQAAGSESVVLVVDDAHRLGDDRIRDLLWMAKLPGVRLVVAYRPPARPGPLADLATLLRERGDLVTLRPYGVDQVAQLVAAAGIPAGSRFVGQLTEQTGGIPGLVARTVEELRGHRGELAEVPDAALGWLRDELAVLPRDVHTYLLAAEAGGALDVEILGRLLGRDADGATATIAAARATGLFGPEGLPVPLVRRAVALLCPLADRVTVRRRLAELLLDEGASVLRLARSLMGTGVAGTGTAAVFEAAADEALPIAPALAARLYASAVGAGRPVPPLATRWAHAAALAGDLDSALRLADRVVGVPDAPDRADAARVAAAALAHRGQLAHSTALYRWAATGAAAGFAATGLIGTGDLASADAILDGAQAAGPSTLFDGAASLMAHGIRESVTGTATTALAALVRATDMLAPGGRTALLPDSPAALTALVALHAGEADLARSTLDRALAAGIGGVLLRRRHRLLHAFTRMARGETAQARQALAAADEGTPTEPRDRLFGVALDLGLARRDNDLARLRSGWADAYATVLRHPVDLFTLLPLGELTVCAARLGDPDRMAPLLAQADTLLGRLGDPPLWSAPLRWARLHAAIVAERTDVATAEAAALGRYRTQFPALATAAVCWLDIMAGTVDPDRIDAAARQLSAVGLAPDGAALAAQAAIRTDDRRATVALLDRARTLQGKPARGRLPLPAPSDLSERELEVASLVVAGLTYKQIGDRLFISPKTIEHHVARMRQRLGCDSRADLLVRLKELVADR